MQKKQLAPSSQSDLRYVVLDMGFGGTRRHFYSGDTYHTFALDLPSQPATLNIVLTHTLQDHHPCHDPKEGTNGSQPVP